MGCCWKPGITPWQWGRGIRFGFHLFPAWEVPTPAWPGAVRGSDTSASRRQGSSLACYGWKWTLSSADYVTSCKEQQKAPSSAAHRRAGDTELEPNRGDFLCM